MPNSEKVKRTDWTDYLVTVDQVESVTGIDKKIGARVLRLLKK